MNQKEIKCPKCGSNQITANKKGNSIGKAVVGNLIIGPVGLLAGGIGSNKIIITCLACGNEFKPEDQNAKIESTRTMEMDSKAKILILKKEAGANLTFEENWLIESYETNIKSKKFGERFVIIVLLVLGIMLFWIYS